MPNTKTPLIVDIETDGAAPQTGRLLAVGYQLADSDVARVIRGDYEHSPESTSVDPMRLLREMLADPERPIVTMTKYDARYLKLQGWDVTGPYYDLQVMAWVLNENQTLSLDVLTKRYLGLTMDKRLKRSKGQLVFKKDDGTLVPMAELDTEAHGQMLDYCIRDVEAETRLFNTLWQSLESTAWLDYFLAEEVPFTEVLLGMETSGLPVDLERSEELRARLQVQHDIDHERLIREGGLPEGFNLNSRKHMASYLYHPVGAMAGKLAHEPGVYNGLSQEDKVEAAQAVVPAAFKVEKVGRLWTEGTWNFAGRGITPTERTESGDDWSTATPVLKSNYKAMTDPWVAELLTYRKVEKLLTTYLRRFPELAQPSVMRWEDGSHGHWVALNEWEQCSERVCDGEARLYGRFNQTGTKTGRLSSSEPNLQNIPSHGELGEQTRALFRGDLVVGDYSQLEPRLMAHFSQDPFLVDVYTTGKDIYTEVAARIFGVRAEDVSPEQRGIGKTLVLAMGYGAGHNKVAQILTINGYPTTPDLAKSYLAELQSIVAVFFAWREAVISRVKQRGYVSTLGGRHRRLKAAFTDRRNWKNVGYGERQAVNAVVQGSAGDIVRRVMVACQTQAVQELTLLAQVHDELVWDWTGVGYGPSEGQLAELRRVAETAHGFDLRVPLVFEPHFGPSWFAAKEGLELPDELLSEESVGYEEE